MSIQHRFLDKKFRITANSRQKNVTTSLNSQLRSKLNINILELHKQISEKSSIEPIIKEIEESLDKLVIELLSAVGKKLENQELLEYLKYLNYNEQQALIVQKFEGIPENISSEEIGNKAIEALVYFRKNLQGINGYDLEDFIREYEMQGDTVQKKPSTPQVLT